MLQKIIAIKNVGRFRNCAAAGDVSFNRLTLVFGENGRGKTTLCAVLRSMFTNAPALVLGRATLGSTAQPEAQFLFSGGTVNFRAGAWNPAFTDIAIFDGPYVSENVFAADVVDTENRRNLYRVIVGAQGITLATEVNQLDDRVRQKTTAIRDSRIGLQRFCPTGMTPDAFIALTEDPEIDTKIATKEQELQAVQHAAQLQQRPSLAAINVPVFPTEFAELLGKTFEAVAADAEKRVAEHIALHKMQTRGEPWLTEGLKYLVADGCPFCGQDLTGVDLIQAYKDFFSKAYHALRNEVTTLSGQVNSALGDRVAGALEQTLLQNSNGVEFWQQYCDLSPLVLPEAGQIEEIMAALRQAARDLLQAKAATPLETVPPNANFTQTLTAFEMLRTSLSGYNASVAAVNALITARKKATRAASLRDVETALAKLKAQKARHTEAVRDLCKADSALQIEKVVLELKKTEVKEHLDTHTEQVITRYGQRINHYLERINAGFRITPPTHTYKGRQPSTTYQIIINQNAVDLGDADTTPDRPSFRNTLSSGDRSTLALAFFLAQLEQDPNRTTKVVVFDDPFTSMDSFRRNNTVHQISKCVSNCEQVIVLSHDANFLKLIWDRTLPNERKTLQLARVGEDNTAIAGWDIEKAVQARFRADIDVLQAFFSFNEGEPRDVIQKLRPVLEGYCRNLFPTQFEDQEMMGAIVGKIRTSGAAHPLFSIADDLDELNIYCRRYYHGENPNAATEAIDDTELQGYVKRTLGLVGCLL